LFHHPLNLLTQSKMIEYCLLLHRSHGLDAFELLLRHQGLTTVQKAMLWSFLCRSSCRSYQASKILLLPRAH
jgi:hypothetical protein